MLECLPVFPNIMKTADTALFQWVPIRSLAPRHRERAALHLLALEPHDRYLRFGFAATDEQVRRYVDGLDFDRDELFGIFNRNLVLIAMAHLAYSPDAKSAEQRATAEFGVSVLKQARGRGYGARLFDRAMLHARNRACTRLYIHALSENAAMLKIAANAGATVERDGPESAAWLKLPPDDLVSRVDELVGQHAAELDFRFKVHARRMSELMGLVRDVGDHIGEKARIASE